MNYPLPQVVQARNLHMKWYGLCYFVDWAHIIEDLLVVWYFGILNNVLHYSLGNP